MDDAQEQSAQPESPGETRKAQLPAIVWVALGAAVLALAGVAGAYYWTHRSAPKAEAPAPVVATSGEEVVLMANVAPRDAVAVASPLEGALESLDIALGGEVLMGQIIGRVTNQRLTQASASAEEQLEAANQYVANLEAQLTAAKLEATRASAESAAAESESERARVVAERQELLYKEGVAPRKAFEESKKEAAERAAESALLKESARATAERAKTLTGDLEAAKKTIEDRTKALDEAAENLRTGEVISPIDGVLVAAKAVPGDAIAADTKDLFHVAPSALKLAAVLEPDPPTEARLAEGMVAEVTLASQPDVPFAARLVKRMLDEGKFQWEAQFDLTEALWKPGEQASVKLRLP